MSRRKSVVATPEPAMGVLRRSARLSSRKNREDYWKPGEDRVLGSVPAPIPAEDEEAPKKRNWDLVREVSKRLVYQLGGSISGEKPKESLESNGSLRRSPRFSSRGCSNSKRERSAQCSSSKPLSASSSRVNSNTASRASCGLNSSKDSSCKMRRSPRFSTGGGSVGRSSSVQTVCKSVLPRCSAKSDKGNSSSDGSCKLRRSYRFSSGGGPVGQPSTNRKNLSESVFTICNTKSEKGKGKDDVDSSDRISCILSESKQVFGACEEREVSVCESERKRWRSDKSFAQGNVSLREEENALCSLVFDSTGDITGERKQEIVLGLRAQTRGHTSLTSDRGTIRSSMESVVKVERDKRARCDMIDKRGEEDVLKPKNKLDGEGSCGWTKEQELALQKAYFTANPSPNFWKKVSKLVPGKSAQECFDRVHSDLITPRQPQPRSRAKKTSLSPIPQFSLSASKLLKPTRPKATLLGNNKRRGNHFAKKTIRHLLEKQCHADQGHGSDLFSVLEPSIESDLLSTPVEKRGSLEKILERSSSAHKKPCSRFTREDTTTIISPPVLKQIKNKALHEKYLDQLHLREAKRKAESARVSGKKNIEPIVVQKKDSVRAVKDNLIFDVRDAIEKLKGLEVEISSSSSEFCYERSESEDEEEAIFL